MWTTHSLDVCSIYRVVLNTLAAEEEPANFRNFSHYFSATRNWRLLQRVQGMHVT